MSRLNSTLVGTGAEDSTTIPFSQGAIPLESKSKGRWKKEKPMIKPRGREEGGGVEKPPRREGANLEEILRYFRDFHGENRDSWKADSRCRKEKGGFKPALFLGLT